MQPKDRPQRIYVVGVTGSGKTYLARQLAAITAYPYFDLDDLYWQPDWIKTPTEVFLQKVETEIAQEQFITTGNARVAAHILWPRADLIIWLDYRFHVSFFRLLKRTITRLFDKQPMCNGNVETLRHVLSRESIMLWLFESYEPISRRYVAALDSPEYGTKMVRLCSPKQTAQWLAQFGKDFSS